MKYGLGNETHLDEEPLPCFASEIVEFRDVFFTQQEGVSTEKLEVSAHDIPGIQLGDKMTIATFVDFLDSIAD